MSRLLKALVISFLHVISGSYAFGATRCEDLSIAFERLGTPKGQPGYVAIAPIQKRLIRTAQAAGETAINSTIIEEIVTVYTGPLAALFFNTVRGSPSQLAAANLKTQLEPFLNYCD